MADGVRNGLGWSETLGGSIEVSVIDITNRDDVFVCDMTDAERRLVAVPMQPMSSFLFGDLDGAALRELWKPSSPAASTLPKAHPPPITAPAWPRNSRQLDRLGVAFWEVRDAVGCESGRVESIVNHSHQVRYRLGFGESQGPGVTVASLENQGKRKSR